MRATRFALVALFLAVALLPSAPSAQAQQDQQADRNLAVSPLVAPVIGEPGDVIRQQVQVQNAGNATLQVTVGSRNFKGGKSENGQPEFLEGGDELTMAAWIRAEPQSVVLKPLATQNFQVTITIPENVASGGHYAAVIFGSVAPVPEGQSGVAIAQEVSTLFLLTVPGKMQEQASIEDFTIPGGRWVKGDGPRFLEAIKVPKELVSGQPNIPFRARVRNTGNVHFKPSGSIAIRRSGTIVKNLSLEIGTSETGQVLPNSIRAVDVKWSTKPKIGIYNARLTLVYGSQNTILTKDLQFYVYPHPMWLVLLVLIVVTLRLLRHRLRNAGRALVGRS